MILDLFYLLELNWNCITSPHLPVLLLIPLLLLFPEAATPDCIPVVLLQNIECEYINWSFQYCFEESRFPDSWNFSSVVRVQEYWREISKMFEKLVNDRILSFRTYDLKCYFSSKTLRSFCSSFFCFEFSRFFFPSVMDSFVLLRTWSLRKLFSYLFSIYALVFKTDYDTWILKCNTVLSLLALTPQNDKTHSNNSSAFVDELCECVWPFGGVGA